MKAVAFHFYFTGISKLFLFNIYNIVRKKALIGPCFDIYIFDNLPVPSGIYQEYITNFIIVANLFHFI